jgi:hypothetical protein
MLPPVIIAEVPRLTNKPANPGDTALMVTFVKLADVPGTLKPFKVALPPPPTRTPPLQGPLQITLAPFSVSVLGVVAGVKL